MPAKSVGAIVTARARLIDLIDRTPNLDWLLLTKRPENVVRLWNEAITEWADPGSLAMPLPNVWIGTSVEDQKTADERIPHLLKIPAAVRFLSCEPLLGPINFEAISYTVQPGYFGDAFRAIHRPGTPNEISKLPQYPGVSWVIVGGESGPHARPMHADWARSIRDQCVAAGVPFHFKQWGQWMPGMLGGGCDTHYRILYRDGTLHEDAKEAHLNVIMPKDQRPNPDAGAHVVSRVGKKAAGRLLDGRTWDEFPNVPVTPAPA